MRTEANENRPRRIAVALSGGGHRASLFGLGVLMYLTDAGMNRDVTSVSSVSGGSLTNGFVAQECDYSTVTAKEFGEHVAQPFARQLAQVGTLWASMFTSVYVVALGIAGLALLLTCWLPMGFAMRAVSMSLGILLLGVLASYRSAVCAGAFCRTLYSRQGRATKLRDVGGKSVQHVMCATELRGGEHVYLAGDFVCSHQLGWGSPADLHLADAIQASAAFPGLLSPRWLRTAAHGFSGGARSMSRFMVLVDGGVYDNMAEQWPVGMDSRRERWLGNPSSLETADVLVVVNASEPLRWGAGRMLRVPFVGEIASLLQVVRVLHDKTTTTRRKALVDRFDRAAREQEGIEGALIMINRSPFWTADHFSQHENTWPERAARARGVIAMLGEENRDQWDERARSNSGVKTTLSRLGGEVAADLLYHGYVLAMANLHVILGFPLLEIPPIDRFRALTT